MKKAFSIMLALSFGITGIAFADNVSLNLQPSTGSVTGASGSTVGWGFALTNTTSDYLVVANSFFCEGGQTPTASTCIPRLGVYSDIIAGNATVVDPGSTVTQGFSVNVSSGLGSFDIYSSAAAGQTDAGLIFVVYDLFDADPFSQPANQIGGDQTTSSLASVSVGTSATVPEPALPVLSGLLVLSLLTGARLRNRKLQMHS